MSFFSYKSNLEMQGLLDWRIFAIRRYVIIYDTNQKCLIEFSDEVKKVSTSGLYNREDSHQIEPPILPSPPPIPNQIPK